MTWATLVMAGFMPAIHVLYPKHKTFMAGTSPAMTENPSITSRPAGALAKSLICP
jgi:hypothetical protein